MEVQSQNVKPITSDEFIQIMERFKGFESAPHVAVAVSGGADSMALAVLSQKWIEKVGGKLTGLIVDHGLRSESTLEAEFVRNKLEERGIEAHILTWRDEKPKARIQERARQKRYELLENWCHHHHVLHLLVAHHGDDQWETVMYRLSKGSDLAGLLAMRPCVTRSFGRILRPLLRFSKADLSATLKVYGVDCVQDPSNQNTYFARVKWRQLYPALSALELDQTGIAQSLEKWTGTYQIYQNALNDVIVNSCRIDRFGCVWVCLETFLKETTEMQGRVLKKIIDWLGGRQYGASFKTIDRIISRLFSKGQKATTVGGCYVVRKQKHLMVMRELRAVLNPVTITQQDFIWDHRFLIHVPETYLGMEVRALGMSLAFQNAKGRQIPSRIIETLPALYQKGELVGLIHDLSEDNFGVKVDCFTENHLID